MKVKILILGLICLFIFIHCDKNLPTSPDLSSANTPIINYFTANPSQISSGFTSTLSWSVSNAVRITIDCEPNTASFVVGEVLAVGTREVSPGETTTYTLTAHDVDGTITKPVTVEVDQHVSRTELEITTIPEMPIFTYYPDSDTSKSIFTIVVTETNGVIGGSFDGEIRSFIYQYAGCWTSCPLEWRAIEASGTVLYNCDIELNCRDTIVQVCLNGIDTEGRKIQTLVDISPVWAD